MPSWLAIFLKDINMLHDEFITSDTHFGHKNIIKYSNRPFASIEEMDNELIHRWNAKVPKNAVIYHLGDLAFGNALSIEELLRRLNGRIRFFPGNHDKVILNNKKLQALFEWCRPFSFHESKAPNKQKIVMCHYAFDVWNKHHHGSWMLHGHSHGSLPRGGRIRMDVGVDCHPNYEPFSFKEIEEQLSGLQPAVLDHHGKPGD